MTQHHVLYPVLGLALLACGVWLFRQEISVAKAEQRSEDSQERQKAIDAERKANKAQLKDALDKLAAVKAKPATIQTVTKYLPLPLPGGSQVAIEPAQGSDKPEQIALTGDVQTNLDWIKDMEISHAECDAKLGSCQKDVTFAGQKLTEMTKDRDNWEDTAKNKTHGFVNHVKRAGKCAWKPAVGALIGSAWGWKGATIGAGTGGVICTF
jgi:hypothetical protein